MNFWPKYVNFRLQKVLFLDPKKCRFFRCFLTLFLGGCSVGISRGFQCVLGALIWCVFGVRNLTFLSAFLGVENGRILAKN